MAEPARRTGAGAARLLLSGFGAGMVPGAPGTVGSTVAAGVFVAVALATVEPWVTAACAAGALLTGALTVGLAPGLMAEEGAQDPQVVVTDEMAGIFVTFLWMPRCPLWLTVAGGFALFRCFDILKPAGIRRLEALKGGWGVLADDLAAGALANLGVRVLALLWGALSG